MGSSSYAPAADLLYLAVLFLGLAAGAAIKAAIYRDGRGGGARLVNWAAVAGSLSVAAFALALSGFGGLVLLADPGFRPVWGCLFCISAASFLFPRAAGFPVVILFGFAVVFYGYFFMRLPVRDGDSSALFEIVGDSDGALRCAFLDAAPYGGTIALPSEGTISIRYVSLSLDRRLPIVGGSLRGAVVGIVFQNPDHPPVLLSWAENHPFLNGGPVPFPGVALASIDVSLPQIDSSINRRYALAGDGSLRPLP